MGSLQHIFFRNQSFTHVFDALDKDIVTTYNSTGIVASVTDRNSVTSNFYYDALNRLTSRDMSDNDLDLTLRYDSNGNRTYMSDGTATFEYEFDNLHRLTKKEDTGESLSISYEYDPMDNRTKMTDPESNVTTYTYDARGSRTKETPQLVMPVSTLAMLVFGQISPGEAARMARLDVLDDGALPLWDRAMSTAHRPFCPDIF